MDRGPIVLFQPELELYAGRLGEDPLAREQEMVVQVACHALTQAIERYSPVGTDTLPIATAAISRMFADLINRLSSAPDVVDVVNRQIEQCGYRLIRTRRH